MMAMTQTANQVEPAVMVAVDRLAKAFTLHTQGGVELPVWQNIDLAVRAGECVVLAGPSGIGKSSLLRCIYGNYLTSRGRIAVRHDGAMVAITGAAPRTILAIRRRTIGYVSQFLRVIPRISTLQLVIEPMVERGMAAATAEPRARDLLARLGIAERLWSVPPATFSGGEQQRVNIARTFAVDYPILLLDEPTAALDADNRRVVAGLIGEARARGGAIIGIFHDAEVRRAVGSRIFDLNRLPEVA